MAIKSDIQVKRIEGAAIQQAFISGAIKIGVVGRSRGKDTAATIGITRGAGSTDSFPALTESPIRGVTKAVGDAGTTAANEEYYPNIHFVVKSGTTILDPTNFGTNDDPTGLTIDWSVAPPLTPPSASSSQVASSTGGFNSATTVYYSLTVVDNNATESNIGSVHKVTIPAPSTGYTQVVLSWRRVEYSSGYKLYRGTLADGSDAALLATISSKNTITFTDDNSASPSGSPPSTNATSAAPKAAEAYTLYYTYGVVTKMTYQEFTSYDAVLEEHGIGSELTNVARIFMNPEFNNAPILATVVPESNNYNGYLDALNLFAENHVQFIIMLYAGTETLATYITNMTPVYSLAASLSDAVQGQKECYAVFALPYKAGWTINDCDTFCNAYQATGTGGKRGILGVPSGFEMTATTWIDEDGASQSDYTCTDPDGYDITPLIHTGAAIARYAGLRDIAEPLTEKDVLGFTFKGRNFTDTEIEQLRDFGCMVVENVSGVAVVSQSVNMSLASVEDQELNISVTEDWMKYDLRLRLRDLRGKKMLSQTLRRAKDIIRDALRQYVDNLRIRYFDPSTVDARQDPNDKTRLLGSFKYMPIYPVNIVVVTYDFTFTV